MADAGGPLIAAGGLLLALVLSFPIRLLSRLLPRPLAIAGAFVILAGLIVFAASAVMPVLAEQLGAYFAAAPGLFGEAERHLGRLLAPLEERGLLPGTPKEFVAGLASDLAAQVRDSAQSAFGSFLSLARSTAEITVGALAAAVVAAYMLADGRKMKAAFLRAAPRTYRRDARELWEAFALTFSRYLSGLGLVMFVQGALSALALWLLGVPYAGILGAWVALTAIVPLVGAWIGAIPAVLVALSVSPTVALLVALVFLAIQQLEGNLLTPRVMGDVLRIHPVVILLTVVGAAQLAGPLGVLLALPSLAVCRVLMDFLRPRLRLGTGE